MNLPAWCACGKPVTFSNETRCEDCYSNDQQKYHGKDNSADVPFLSLRQEAEADRRTAQIKSIFQSGGSNVRENPTAPRP